MTIECENKYVEEGNVLYVMVLFGQKPEETKAYSTLLCKSRHVYIHDNTPEEYAPPTLPEGWHYVHTPDNPGLSAAYNMAARYAEEKGYKWLMITDQDTEYQQGAMTRYEKLANEESGVGIYIPKVKIPDGNYISPVKKRHYMSRPEKVSLSGIINLKGAAVINSGLLINLKAFRDCGGYNEKVFLDFADYQFIDRLSTVTTHGTVIEEELLQSFSGVEDTGGKQIDRFRLFCRSLKGYERKGESVIMIPLVIMKRCLSLVIGRRELEPLRIMISELKGKREKE